MKLFSKLFQQYKVMTSVDTYENVDDGHQLF